MEFRLLIDADVVDILSRFSARKRQRFYAHFRQLQNYPKYHSDKIVSDFRGRQLDISIFEGHEIRYWFDMADRHVKILEMVKMNNCA